MWVGDQVLMFGVLKSKGALATPLTKINHE